jgi:signal transduction histidine kinase
MAQAAQSAREDELRNSRQRIVAAQESVRRDIAQQLHGSVQNRLIMLILRLKELEDADQSVDVSEGIKDLRLRFEELLDKEIRSISHQLYPMILRRGLIPALQSLGDQFENVFPIQLELEAGLQQRERSDHNLIPEQVRLAAYRTAEEALTNAMKHAQASAVTITVGSPDEGWLGIAVHDDGEGFEPDSIGDGLGLVGMRDYVEVAGGDFKIKSSPANGTEVSACLPLSGLGSESPEKAAS